MDKDVIKIMIVDDMEAHRRRLQRSIEIESDMKIVASCADGYEAVMMAQQHEPHVILMDIEMENKWAGIYASKQINKVLPNIKIIVLTMHDDDKTVYAAFQTGIVDYIIKSVTNPELIQAIRSAHENRSPIRPIIAEKIRKEFRKTKQSEENLLYILKLISELTPSEFEILKLLCQGATRNEVSRMRVVELGTVKKQINSILKKCEHSNTKDLVEQIKSTGILDILAKL